MLAGGGTRAGGALLLCRVAEHVCGLPLVHVRETMRPLRLQPLPHVPPFVVGVAIVRGGSTPVLDGRLLLGQAASSEASARWVSLTLGERSVALVVDSVIGVRVLPAAQVERVPPLLKSLEAAWLAELTSLDKELLLVLECTKLAPVGIWAGLSPDAGPLHQEQEP
jgi:purine-binding chemotaxis protein CheW